MSEDSCLPEWVLLIFLNTRHIVCPVLIKIVAIPWPRIEFRQFIAFRQLMPALLAP